MLIHDISCSRRKPQVIVPVTAGSTTTVINCGTTQNVANEFTDSLMAANNSTNTNCQTLLERRNRRRTVVEQTDYDTVSYSCSTPKRRRARPPSLCAARATPFTKLTALLALAMIFVAMPADFLAASAKTVSRTSTTGKRLAVPVSDSSDAESTDAKSGIYDNQITGEPEIECGYGVVHFRVFTSKGRASAVYVRGQAENADCVFHNAGNVTIELAKCNIRRKREVNPSGVAYQMTVVVQMHPLFVTKVDRAYNVNCFYMERRQDVGVEFGVSDIATQPLMQDAVLPNCTYSVHRDSPNGPLVKYTKVGEQLYHVWECASTMYKMLLYNCAAVDGKGGEYGIIDENGCSKDEFLMPQISYSADTTKAMVASAAFNFPDRNTMSFACKIRLCYTNECSAITPPNCGKGKSGVTPSSLDNEDLDNEQLYRGTSTPKSSSASRKATTTAAADESEAAFSSTESDADPTTADADGETETVATTEESTTAAPRSPKTTRRASTTPKRRTTTTAAAASTTPTTTTTTEEPTTRRESAIPEEDEQEDDQSTPSALPDDFPRPGALDLHAQADEPIEDASGETPVDEYATQSRAQAPNFVEKKKLPSAGGESAEFFSRETSAESHGTTKPVVVFNKVPSTKADAANAKNAAAAAAASGASANRLARDTTLPAGGRSAPPRRSISSAPPSKHVVDFDISSDELTIIDGYDMEPGTAEKLASPSSATPTTAERNFGGYQRRGDAAPLLDIGAGAGDRATAVCFSPLVLALAGALFALFFTTVAFILLKTRKTVHNFH